VGGINILSVFPDYFVPRKDDRNLTLTGFESLLGFLYTKPAKNNAI